MLKAVAEEVSGGGSTPFSISEFSDGNSSPIEISTGVWQAIGALSFTASYTNGPASAGTVSMSGAGNTWSPNSLAMTNTFQGPTATTQVVDYPSVDGSITFTLSATGPSGGATKTITHTFNNYVYYGTSTKNSGFTGSDVTGLAGSNLQTGLSDTFTTNAASGYYVIYAYPARYGDAQFAVGGFVGGFQGPATVSVTNSNGYTENYYVYNSTHSGLGAIQVVVTPAP